MITFGQLYEEIISRNHPAGLAENLAIPFRKTLISGLIHIQRYVKCLQEDNTHHYPYCSTTWNCGMTVVGAPDGIVSSLYTVRTSDHCARVRYVQLEFDDLWCENARRRGSGVPVDAPPVLPTPFKHPDPALDRTRRTGYGFWSLHQDLIWVTPFIHSSETLVAEYDGLKKSWIDADSLKDDSETLVRAISLYSQKEMQRDYEKDITAYQASTIEFQDALRDLIYDCREKTRVRETQVCAPDRLVCAPCGTSSLTTVDEFVEVDTESVFAAFGDYGDPTNGTAEQDVADLVNSWSPDYLVTLGDNQYGIPCDYEAKVGAFYEDYITTSLATNRFWPSLGNHDIDDCGFTPYHAFFSVLAGQNYYEIVKGVVHWFILNTEPEEPDGKSVTSIQALWLKARLATSKAKWKIVVTHNAPYTSQEGDAPGHVDLRWPFQEWGADLVLNGDGHLFERVIVDGFNYITAGTGGRIIDPVPGVLVDGSEVVVSAYGALKGTATCKELKLEFIDIDLEVRDTLVLTKD